MVITKDDLMEFLECHSVNTAQIILASGVEGEYLTDLYYNDIRMPANDEIKLLSWSRLLKDHALVRHRMTWLMESKGISLTEFCFAMDVSPSTYHRWMARNGTLNQSHMAKLCSLEIAEDDAIQESIKYGRDTKRKRMLGKTSPHIEAAVIEADEEDTFQMDPKGGKFFFRTSHRVGPSYIQLLREDSSLTQKEFGQLIGLGPEAIGRWERRLDRVPTARKKQIKHLGIWVTNNQKSLRESPYWITPVSYDGPSYGVRISQAEREEIEEKARQVEVKADDAHVSNSHQVASVEKDVDGIAKNLRELNNEIWCDTDVHMEIQTKHVQQIQDTITKIGLQLSHQKAEFISIQCRHAEIISIWNKLQLRLTVTTAFAFVASVTGICSLIKFWL